MSETPEWRGQRDTPSRAWRALAFSVLLHLPLTPVAALVGLMALVGTGQQDEGPPVAPITAIPIDLIEVPEGSGPAGRPGEDTPSEDPEAAKASASEADPFDELEKEADAPALVPTPKDEPQDPAEADKPPAETPDAKGTKGKGPNVGDPVSMSGSAGRVADANANVRLLIFADRIRGHQLGRRIGELLGAAEQWREFFGPGGLDPVTDIDRILIAGPQLRDSRDVVAVLRVSADPERVRQAVDALVQRGEGGEWLDAGVPAARARADRADRVFILPSPNIVVVAPPSAADNAIKQSRGLRFPNPKGNEALTVYVVTPWRAFIGIPFHVPKSIAWVRMKITPTPDGGAVAELLAEDESEEAAGKNARLLMDGINEVSRVDLKKQGGVMGKAARFLLGDEVRLLEPVTFTASGKEIHGRVVATPKQLGSLLEAISGYAEERARQVARKRAAAADGGVDAAPKAPSNATRPPDAARPSDDRAPDGAAPNAPTTD